jgi:hypothetical protein
MSTVADQDADSRRASPLLPSPAPRRQEASQSDLAFFLVDAYSANPVTRARSASNGSRSSNSETAPSPAMAADSAHLAYYDPQSQAYAPTATAPTEADNTAAGLPETRGSKQVQAETTTSVRDAPARSHLTVSQRRASGQTPPTDHCRAVQDAGGRVHQKLQARHPQAQPARRAAEHVSSGDSSLGASWWPCADGP